MKVSSNKFEDTETDLNRESKNEKRNSKNKEINIKINSMF